MSLRLTTRENVVALYDSVTDWAFGPVFYSESAAEKFMDWAAERGIRDLRSLSNPDLSELWDAYTAQGGERE